MARALRRRDGGPSCGDRNLFLFIVRVFHSFVRICEWYLAVRVCVCVRVRMSVVQSLVCSLSDEHMNSFFHILNDLYRCVAFDP